MEKIQQLLNQHKDKLWYPELSISTQDWWFKIYKHRNHSNPLHYRSLSEVLFNTPFLSWLKWEDLYDWDDWIKYDQYEVVKNINDSDYHKINLVLLSTDSERIKYVEQFVL